MTACLLGWCGGGVRGISGTASQDQGFGLTAQDADRHVVPGGTGCLSGPRGDQLVQPALGLVTAPQAMMGQGQEGKSPWQAPATTGLKAFVQTADGFLESAG